MGVSRISSNYLIDRGVFNLQQNLLLTSKIQEQISSGKNILNPSDDPIALTQLLRLDSEQADADQFSKNIMDGLSELSTADNAMSRIVEVATRARELAIQASTVTTGSVQLSAIKNEIEVLINQLVQLGNTSFAGRHIFAGFKTDSVPFVQTGSDIDYVGSQSLAGEDYEREIQVGKNSNEAINLPGDQLLGEVQYVAGVPVGQGLLYTLSKLKTDIENTILGTATADDIRANIDLIQTDQQDILQMQTVVGSKINKLEAALSRYENQNIIQAQQIAKIQEVDLPAAISRLSFQQNILQVSMSMMGRILQTSLVNFLS